MPAPLEIKVMDIDTAGWTPIVVPFDCSSISVKNADQANDIRMRTTANNPTTQDLLNAGGEQTFAVPFHRYRFLSGSQPVWLQAVAGTGPVVLKFLA